MVLTSESSHKRKSISGNWRSAYSHERTLVILKTLRSKIFNPKTKQFGRRILTATCDGPPAKFRNSVDECFAYPLSFRRKRGDKLDLLRELAPKGAWRKFRVVHVYIVVIRVRQNFLDQATIDILHAAARRATRRRT